MRISLWPISIAMFSSAPWITAAGDRIDAVAAATAVRAAVVHRASPCDLMMRLPARSLVDRCARRHDGGAVHLQHDGRAGDRLADRQQVAAVEGRSRTVASSPSMRNDALCRSRLGPRQRRAFRRRRELGDLRHRAGADHPDVDDLDRAARRSGGRTRACAPRGRLPDLGRAPLRRWCRRGMGMRQLVALADVAQIAVADEVTSGARRDDRRRTALGQLRFHRGEVGVERARGRRRPLTWNAVRMASYLRSVVSRPDGRGDARDSGGTITSGMPSMCGDLGAVQRSGAAEGDQRVIRADRCPSAPCASGWRWPCCC